MGDILSQLNKAQQEVVTHANQYTHPWTKREIDFVRANINKLTYKEMGKYINRTPTSIQSKVRFFPFKQKVKKYRVNQNFFKRWSPAMAYILGFIAADGSLIHHGRAHVLHIANDNRDIIRQIKTALQSEGKIIPIQRDNGKTSHHLRICDKEIFYDLQRHGITERKSLTITPPKYLSAKHTRHYIRGFFDGDGSVFLSGKDFPSKLNVVFYTASHPMIRFLFNFVKNICPKYSGSILKGQNINIYYLHLGQRDGEILFNKLYKDADIFIKKKYKIFLKGLS